MVTSIGMSNVVWVLLLANWMLEGRWREKWLMARESRLLQAVGILFLLHIVGLLWTSNLPAGLHVVERLLPWMAVPLVVLTTHPPEERARQHILGIYVGTLVVVSIIGLVRWHTIPGLPYRDIVPFISHIRFALNVCMAIILLCSSERLTGGVRIVRYLLVLWFLAFLLLLRSYTAFVVLPLAALAVIWRLRHRWLWLAVLLSFLFYFPVVLWAQAVPLIGMMMLPKTCMYIWMILMFRKAEKET